MTGSKLSITIDEIPVSRALDLFELARSLPYGVTFDSSPGFGVRGLYSYACADPFFILSYRKDIPGACTDPFQVLREMLETYAVDSQPTPTPFAVGAAGFFSYDLGRSLEDLGEGPLDDIGTPDMSLAFYDQTVAVDHGSGRAWIYSITDRPAWTGGCCKRKKTDAPAVGRSVGSLPESSFSKEAYLEAVRRAKEYIAAGDIYQVNLSQRFMTTTPEGPQALYNKLMRVNPAPYGCFLDFGGYVIASASPEEFLTYDHQTRIVRTSPIKGTRPRGKTPEEDEKLKAELMISEKDRAENVMIVDLERNDLGKVCSYGSVRVTDLYGVETHPTVHHLVSVVEGRLDRRHDIVDLLKAAFPGGSITGAPKLRSMQIIDELEPVRRGIYTGSAGYIDFRGNMSLNILIRSFMIHGGMAYFHAGGGIVADSDPDSEYQETLDKVEGLMRALDSDE